ncbi:YigZ family protein [Lacticaseibacillus zhaodongensis]|uniref:YigZ family protein n=1 Tax=Lacticaseibacillus zhaodongensis TaxID=2668065 RepID=UPI0018AFD501|nr:YigZ family protein [Lacticaseibacillus zhaodongensis]
MTKLTIARPTQTEIEIKKSRFITQLQRVSSNDAAEAFVAEVRATNRKANHNVWAARVGWPISVERASDDGEPSGTAGAPTLRGLTAHDLSNVVAVTTRYFGGIKLGASGLIRAYTSAVTAAIIDAGIVRIENQRELIVDTDYSSYDPLINLLKEEQLPVTSAEFTAAVRMHLFLNETDTARAQELITSYTKGRARFTNGATRNAEIPVPIQTK